MKTIKPSTNDAIIEAAFQTFSEKPGASLGDVAARAGVGRATLHRYYSSRQKLMVALAHTALSELNEAVDAAVADAKSHTDGLRLALGAIIPLASRQWFLSHELVGDDPGIASAYQSNSLELQKEIDAAKEEGSFDREISSKWIAEVYENLIYAAWTMVRFQEATPSQAANTAWRIFMKGVSQ